MKRVNWVNLGCAKNEVDSEEMLGQLALDGYELDRTGGSARSDVVVINTCSFIESAREQSIDAILAAVERKKRGDVDRVIVTGCLSQRYGSDLADELTEVDAFLGTGQMGQIRSLVRDSLIRPDQLLNIEPRPQHKWLDAPTRVRLGSPWSAYLKISEGCDHKCTFCAIPRFRGAHVSKPVEKVLAEAADLAARGVREINLIAQDSTQYGYDLYGKMRLPDLLRELSAVDGIRWIRVFYCYPSRVNRGVIEAIATTPKVCQYIDMPLQHSEDEILRAMRRPMTRASYLDLVRAFRSASPDVALRTTFIVGFPGEKQRHFDRLSAFIEEARFDHVGVFEFSVETETDSAKLPYRIGAAVKRRRREQLMERQQAVSLAQNQAWIGRELEVLVEGRSALDPTSAVGRSFRDAPEVDGKVFVKRCTAKPGEFITTRVVEARPYDLVTEPLGTFSERQN